jgi:hypothetical protein
MGSNRAIIGVTGINPQDTNSSGVVFFDPIHDGL